MSKFKIGERVLDMTTSEQVEIVDLFSEGGKVFSARVHNSKGWIGVRLIHDLVKIKRPTLGKVESYDKRSGTTLNEQDVLSLIDVALDTGDREWFNELVVMLNDARAVSVV